MKSEYFSKSSLREKQSRQKIMDLEVSLRLEFLKYLQDLRGQVKVEELRRTLAHDIKATAEQVLKQVNENK